MDHPEQNKLYAHIPVEELLKLESEENQSSLEEMSAQELLDLLEQDVNSISQIEQRKLQGIETLLEAMAALKQNPVEERLDQLVAHTLKFHAPQSLPVKSLQVASMAIEEKAANLAKTARLLKQQEAEVAQREVECDQITIDLLAAQQLLLIELDTVLERLDDRDNGETSQPLRRVA